MKNFILILIISLLVSVSTGAQTAPATTQDTKTTAEAKPKKQSFRATKEQVMQVQKMLKVAETGKRDGETKAAIKKYQTENGLKSNGTLNRATLEKMGIELTDTQKEIPVSPSSFASAEPAKSSDSSEPKKMIFRASKDQIMQAQKMLKVTETGKLDDTTRDGLKIYQAANGLNVTGTLNQVTLEKMGIALTDKQKENSMKDSQ